MMYVIHRTRKTYTQVLFNQFVLWNMILEMPISNIYEVRSIKIGYDEVDEWAFKIKLSKWVRPKQSFIHLLFIS